MPVNLTDKKFSRGVSVLKEAEDSQPPKEPKKRGRPPKNKEIFAVYLSDVVKVEWVCKPGTTLIESRMGKLNNIGAHNFVCLEKISLNFEMHISNTITHQGIEFYPVSRDGGDLEEIPFQVNKNKAIKSENMELKSLQKEASFLTRMLSIFSSKK
jgi:hypothetical protein